jgi:hypothetical protein
MRIVLDLSDQDVRYFRSCLQTVKKGTLSSDESVVLKAAADLMAQVAAAEAPEYVQDRIGKLALLVQMLEDQRWRLTGPDRARVLNVLAYFVDPDDLIPTASRAWATSTRSWSSCSRSCATSSTRSEAEPPRARADREKRPCGAMRRNRRGIATAAPAPRQEGPVGLGSRAD